MRYFRLQIYNCLITLHDLYRSNLVIDYAFFEFKPILKEI